MKIAFSQKNEISSRLLLGPIYLNDYFKLESGLSSKFDFCDKHVLSRNGLKYENIIIVLHRLKPTVIFNTFSDEK